MLCYAMLCYAMLRYVMFVMLCYVMLYLTIIRQRRSRGEYLPRFTDPEVNDCFRLIFRGEYQELKNKELKHGNNKHMCSLACV